jgi:hypothetical protein
MSNDRVNRERMDAQGEQSRRDLLRVSAGAVVLAASGLLLPTLDGEVEARDKRKRRRRSRRKNGDQPGTGGLPQRDPLQLRGVSLSIHNMLSTPVAVREWVNQFEPAGWKLTKDWQTIEGKPTTGPEHVVDLVDAGIQVVAELNTGHIILGGNRPIGFPWLTIGKGGWSADGWKPQGETLLDRSFAEGDRFVAGSFVAERLEDSDDYKRFVIYLV